MMKHPAMQRLWTVITWAWLVFLICLAGFLVLENPRSFNVANFEFDRFRSYDFALGTLAGLVVGSQIPRAISYILTGQFRYFPIYSNFKE